MLEMKPSFQGGVEFAAGDECFYFLPRAPKNGRPVDLYLAVTVKTITKKRVVVKQRNGRGGARILKASNLIRTPPEGAWIK